MNVKFVLRKSEGSCKLITKRLGSMIAGIL